MPAKAKKSVSLTPQQTAIRTGIVKAYAETSAQLGEIGYKRALAFEEVYAQAKNADDVKAALKTPEGTESGSTLSKTLSYARLAYRLRCILPDTYRAVMLAPDAGGWEPRIASAREAVRDYDARMALATKRATIIAEAAVRMGVAEQTASENPEVASRVDAVTAEHKAALQAREDAKHDPIASADRFAKACVLDNDRGLDWLAAYAQRLAVTAIQWRKEREAAKAKASEAKASEKVAA